MNDIKVMVVDDSAFMRKVIGDIITAQPDMRVVATARNGQEALKLIKTVDIDVITMDVEMPIMNGLQALEKIMSEDPLPVIMLSSLTQRGADATMKALCLGAVDFISKPSGTMGINNTAGEITRKIKIAAATRYRLRKQSVQPIIKKTKPIKTAISANDTPGKLVLIGTSTGGPKALHEVIPKLPGNLGAAVLVVQHMPSGFTRSLAERLDRLSSLRVKEAEDGERILRGCVYIAPGDFHLKVRRSADSSNRRLMVNLTQDNLVSGHRPSVDAMLDSVVNEYWSKIITVIMTGMGQDGAKGASWVKSKGGKVIAEDSSTCIVYGMPKAVIETGNADKILPLQNIANAIAEMVL